MIKLKDILDIFHDYDDAFDLFVALYTYCESNEGSLTSYIDSGSSIFTSNIESDEDAETLEVNVRNLVIMLIENEAGCKDRLKELFDEHSDNLEVVLIMFIRRFDQLPGEKMLAMLNDNMKRGCFKDYSALNKNTHHLGKLYLSSNVISYVSFPLGRQSKHRGSAIEVLLKYFTVIRESKDYKVVASTCVDKDVLPLRERIRSELKIGISSITSKDVLNIRMDDNLFFIEGIKSEAVDTLMTKVLNVLEDMNDEAVDVAIFPEMIFSSGMKSEIEDFLTINQLGLKLIVLGSVWENKRNTSYILSGKGRVVHEQDKLNRFHTNEDYLENGLTEGIDIPSNRDIKVLDILDFGRIANLICVDNVNNDIEQMTNQLAVNYYFSPAYTGSLAAMKDFAKGRRSNHGGLTAIANICEKMISKEKEETSFFTDPFALSESPFKCTSNCNSEGMKSCNYNICYDVLIIDVEAKESKYESVRKKI